MRDPALTERNGELVVREIARRAGISPERLRGARRYDTAAVRGRELVMWVLVEAGWGKREATRFVGLVDNAACEALKRLKQRGTDVESVRPLVDVATGKGSPAVALTLVRETFPDLRREERDAIARYLTGVFNHAPLDVYGMFLLGGSVDVRWRVFTALYTAALHEWVPTIKQQLRVSRKDVA